MVVNPGPPNAPNSFCAPCAMKMMPITTRANRSAQSTAEGSWMLMLDCMVSPCCRAQNQLPGSHFFASRAVTQMHQRGGRSVAPCPVFANRLSMARVDGPVIVVSSCRPLPRSLDKLLHRQRCAQRCTWLQYHRG